MRRKRMKQPKPNFETRLKVIYEHTKGHQEWLQMRFGRDNACLRSVEIILRELKQLMDDKEWKNAKH